jgi:hypothetical protein
MCSGDYTQQLWLTPQINRALFNVSLKSTKLEPLGTGRTKIKFIRRVKACIRYIHTECVSTSINPAEILTVNGDY